MKVKFENHVNKYILEKEDLKDIENSVEKKRESIERMKKEFLKIPKDVRDYFTAEMNIWNKVKGEKGYMANVFMMSPMVGGISLTSSEVGRPKKDNLLIGRIHLDKK